jgi:RimJ/RimL family protein N-acetyltransferase
VDAGGEPPAGVHDDRGSETPPTYATMPTVPATREIHGDLVTLAPLAPEHAQPLRAIHEEAAVSVWWGLPEDEFPLSDEPTATRFAILVGGEVAGMIQYTEEPEPSYRHAELDIFVGTAHQGRGVGTDAVRTLARHLTTQRGHHRLVIAPAAHNHAAVRAYENAGFTRVGITRLSAANELTGEWHDELYMERVSAPPPPRGTARSPERP